MRRRFWFALAPLLAGCGYVGDVQPPALDIPVQIKDLRAVQRGGLIYIVFTPSLQSTDNLQLKELKGINLRIGLAPEGGWQEDRWDERSQQIPVAAAKGEQTEVTTPAAPWAGKEAILGVRAIGPTGRSGKWSNFVALQVVPPMAAPAGFTAKNTPRGIQLQWQRGDAPAGANWRVYRSAGKDTELLLGVAKDPDWLDTTSRFGNEYTYSVQTVVKAGEGEAESDPSAAVTIAAGDVFPPDRPQGLVVTAGLNGTELSWNRSLADDFKSYSVYRADGDAPLVKIADGLTAPSYSDAKTEAGKRYRYAITATDDDGNESAQCEPVSVVAP